MADPMVAATSSPGDFAQYAWRERWQWARHVRYLNDRLIELARRDYDRLMVWMPPRHGKSVLASTFFPAWYLGTFPTHDVMIVGYGQEFVSEFGQRTRDLMTEYGDVFGVRVRKDIHSKRRWSLEDHGGSMRIESVKGQITGRGANLIVVDDPVKNAEEAISEQFRDKSWQRWQGDVSTRFEPDAVCVIIQTRWHQDDLCGRLLQEEGDRWKVVSFPAIAEEHDVLGRKPGEALWPERYNAKWFEENRGDKAAYWWDALYQQRPSTHESVLWPRDYFEGDDLRFDEWPANLQMKVMALDPSKGTGTKAGDYSAYVVLGISEDGSFWVEADMDNSRAAKQIVADGCRLIKEHGINAFGVESNANQHLFSELFEPELQRQRILHLLPMPIHNKIKKELRIERLDEWFSRRLVRFRNTPGTERLLQQLRDFPVANNDDGPDALEMAVRLAAECLGIDYEEQAGAVS